jgi:predicted DNA binding CopG/RHH family protein
MNDKEMRSEYDFTNSKKNPYVAQLKKSITIRLEAETVNYFKELAKKSGIPYQTLINLFLTQCAKEHKKPEVVWQ